MTNLQRKIGLIGLISIFTFSALPAHATWRWMEYSPSRYFNEDDWDKLKATARELLDNGKDGDMATWSNKETDNGGRITLMSTYEEDNTTCRRVKIFNVARSKGLTGEGTYRLCKQPDGTWKIAP